MGFGNISGNLPPTKINKKKPGFKSATKLPSSSRRRPLENETIYGEELFATAHKKEKEIVVCFFPFTDNKVRISNDFKFAIEYKVLAEDEEGNNEFFSLYYFKENPISDFDKDTTKFYNLSDKSFALQVENTPNLKEIEEKVTECVKIEYAIEKKKKLAEIIANEEAEKADLALKDAQADEAYEKEQENVLATGDEKQFLTNTDSEINNEEQDKQKDNEIPLQEKQKISGDVVGEKETREFRKSGFSQIKEF